MPLASLRPADSPRREPEDAHHVRLLANSGMSLMPIIVHRSTMRVVDGTHRVRAAALRGDEDIDVCFFDGCEQDAFVFAVASNIRHGLPLSLSERTAAAVRILGSHPEWSDRAIASVTGLSPKTVGAQRQKAGGISEVTTRIGRDGRARPLNSAERRRAAGKLILEFPEASLREIAKQAGISPGTVRDVRDRLSRGEDVVPSRQRGGGAGAAADPAGMSERPLGEAGEQSVDQAVGEAMDAADIFRSLCRDPSLRLTENGRQLLRMVEAQLLDSQVWDRVAQSVPPHRAQSVSALALECAQQWQRFASRIEGEPASPVA
ncbi:ParB N-terminal domain-containing protein [Streptomyces sp. NPDC058045]|uniref:ParB N-terminal domain-containing protein n=1 Tax=Streptomyces sp. NPDC058045 TaxID=3346311 RepID=UPI0036E320DC